VAAAAAATELEDNAATHAIVFGDQQTDPSSQGTLDSNARTALRDDGSSLD
jgi:hypothetical protein